ncbi:hypothetical protein [Nocardioides daphniae]|uniref:Uncharacterized protein n=1 Tax=Nocardioides daphniae TaxID=402297 RepID=A0A4P7UDV6_9ACTN|nr:hypothetical protein [Nocardioides daphniae]QCC78044.1 hypothetical protein E2C04_14170 [Nocardioides daphniae]GGD22750.1 hypothetical protein GCM10007231_22280 [Nocardioides daphniae]
MSDLLTRVRDLESTESRLVQAAATGLFTVFVSPRRLQGRPLNAVHALTGLAGVAGGALAIGESASPGQRAAAGALVGATVTGASVLGMAADRRLEGWLRGKGVRHPRLWFGVVAALATWSTSAPRATEESEAEPDAKSDAKGGAEADHR